MEMKMEEAAQTVNEVECPYCAEKIQAKAKKCKHCGEAVGPAVVDANPPKQNSSIGVNENVSKKSRLAALLLCTSLGFFGAYQFYLGKKKYGIAMIILAAIGYAAILAGPAWQSIYEVSGGAVLIWWVFDLFRIFFGRSVDSEGKPLRNWL
jgi:TM2 domain-containing membrane protein YozV